VGNKLATWKVPRECYRNSELIYVYVELHETGKVIQEALLSRDFMALSID
jgi:hypothetical protein